MDIGAYVAELWNAWLWWAGGMLTAVELTRFLWKRSWGWPERHPWRMAVGLLLVAQFGAYQSLSSKAEQANASRGAAIEVLTKERDKLAIEKATLEGANREKDKLILQLNAANNDLRDKLADVREKRPIDVRVSGSGVKMPAVSEGFRVTTRQVPSPDDAAPYAHEITIQVSAPVQPFGVLIRSDKALAGARGGAVGQFTYQLRMSGLRDPKTYALSWASPPVTPQSPVVIVVWAKEPFSILRVERQ